MATGGQTQILYYDDAMVKQDLELKAMDMHIMVAIAYAYGPFV